MATLISHTVRSSGLLDALHAAENQRDEPLRFFPRIRVRLPLRIRPRPLGGPTAGRPGRAGGAGGFRGTGQAIAMAVGAVALEKLWPWRWYALGGLGAYVLIRCVNSFRHRRRNLRVQVPISIAHLDENSDGNGILSAYLLEMLKKEECSSLDVQTAGSSFVSHQESTGPAVAFYCVEHLHLKVVNHVNCQAPFMKDVKLGLDRLGRMILARANQRDANTVNEIGNGVTFCGLSKAGQGIGLFINKQLGGNDCWDCCAQSIEYPIFVERSYDDMSYMAARRVSSAGTLIENVPGDPDFIIFACDGVCDLLQNLVLVQFAYQGVRNGMPLRPLCETLLELMQSSSLRRAVLVVQFKFPCDTPHQLPE